VSRLAIKNWLGPEKLRLDIGCSRLVLQRGKTTTVGELPNPLKSGIPHPETVAGLRAAIVSLCESLPARKRVLEITISDILLRSWIVERLPGLASLTEIAALYDWQLAKIQPRFARSFNGWRSNPFKRAKPVIFSLDTPDGLSIAIRNAEQWQALRTHPPLALLGSDLPAMLRRECRAAGLLLEDCRIEALPWVAMEQST
jgi:hypothetical protein